MQTGILIIGGGLSGLSLAWLLEVSGRACLLVEARERLQARVPARKVLAGHVVSELSQTEAGVRATVIHDGRAGEIDATHVVLAVPPRLAASAIRFDPALTAPQMASLNAVPTWMADQAKLIAIYPTPFWRAAGLSGDGISRRGPLAEIHDASPASGSRGALEASELAFQSLASNAAEIPPPAPVP